MVQHTPAPKVLVVEDERALADIYGSFLEPDYEVRVAYSGEQAIELLDFEPDVVLLDRHMSGISGEDVLKTIQARNDDTRVAMVTALQPDFDIVEFGIDEYLVKPIDEDDLIEAVERVLTFEDLDEMQVALSSKKLKRNLLEVEKSPEELVDNEAFHQLEAEIDRLETEIAALETALEEPERSVALVS